MKRSILAARTELAIQRIATETLRLGGEFVAPSVKGDVEHQQLALLEAIASTLVSIETPVAVDITIPAKSVADVRSEANPGKAVKKKGSAG